MVIAKLSLRSSNMWHCSKEICHKTTERESESEREREKERKKESEKERKRASELDAKCYGICRKQGTTGWISLIGFARSVFVHKPSLMDCRVWSQVIAFGGPYRFTVFRAHLWQKIPAILKSSLQPFWPWLIHIYIHTHMIRVYDRCIWYMICIWYMYMIHVYVCMWAYE